MKYLVLFYFTIIGKIVIAQTYNLAITIPNLKSTDGEIQFGIYNKKENFPLIDKQYKFFIVSAGKFSGTYTFHDLPKGEYAVAILHDKNADKICNTNFLGIPKEGYGFSKNFKPKFSAPSFNDCKIEINSNTSINIKLLY